MPSETTWPSTRVKEPLRRALVGGHDGIDLRRSTWPDETSVSVHVLSYRAATGGYSAPERPEIPLEATTGIEPV
jgi:hypothetical protein